MHSFPNRQKRSHSAQQLEDIQATAYYDDVEVRTEQIRNGPLQNVFLRHSVKAISLLLRIETVRRRCLLFQVALQLTLGLALLHKVTTTTTVAE